MLSQKVLEYVDDVMSMVTAPEESKTKLENELIRHILKASVHTNVDKVINELGSPEELADEISRKSGNCVEFDKQNVKCARIPEKSCREPAPMRNCDRYPSPRYSGEYTREESNVNIKLLYIPLIQISSGTERIRLPIDDRCYFD